MKLSSGIITFLLAAVLAIATVSAAHAFTRVASTALNVRKGPGTNFRVIDTLYDGEVVDVQHCNGRGWCFVRKQGRNGWVYSAYLEKPGGVRRVRACFYNKPHYDGRSFCQAVGRLNTLPKQFNNKITSIRVFGRASVRICGKRFMEGRCRMIHSNTPHLGPVMNENVSSLRVFK